MYISEKWRKAKPNFTKASNVKCEQLDRRISVTLQI